ncbi:MAG TPA: NAD(P)H-binding protein [Bacteriovoracaceae bacterium]|nr:NAD(P)H-binding protein [Bacteriovoracaceae bacterium]
MNLLLVGSTGLVGSHVLDLALESSQVEKVTVISRRPMKKSHAKLRVEVVNFDQLPEVSSWWKADAVICTLGTTIKKAGSKEAFRKVDFTYPLEVAKRARTNGTSTYVLNSAMGANKDSRFFYNQVKGQLETQLKEVGFRSLTFVRPGMIGGKREEFRLGEEVGKLVLGLLSPLLPKSLRINHPRNIAKELVEAALISKPGINIISSEKMSD